MTLKGLNTLTCSYIPQFASAIYTSRQTVITCKIKLTARKFALMTF